MNSVVAFQTAEQIEEEFCRRIRVFVAEPSQPAGNDIMALFSRRWRAVTGSTDGESEARAQMAHNIAAFRRKAAAA